MSSRKIALLGGTTRLGDCLVALSYLLRPWRLAEGPHLRDFEEAFADYVGVRYAYAFAHGRVGLYGILEGLGIGPGDEVLLQVPTHIVVPNAIRYTGARPVYVDCELGTYNMDLAAAEGLVSERTKALLVQHTFGIPADLERAAALAERHGLQLVEDCVHSLGSIHRERRLGSFGSAAFFSTEETKTISTTMGGLATTDDPALAATLRRFQERCARPAASLTARYLLKLIGYHLLTEPRLHPITRALYERLGSRQPLPGATSAEERRGSKPVAYEKRLGNAQAALGLRQLRRIDANVAHRRAIADAYRRALADADVVLPAEPEGSQPAYVRFPVRVRDRESSVEHVAPHAVLGRWFTSVLGESASPEAGGYESGSCPNAEIAGRDLVNLPTHGRVTMSDARAIAAALAAAQRATTPRAAAPAPPA